jgi:hypothetical protein
MRALVVTLLVATLSAAACDVLLLDPPAQAGATPLPVQLTVTGASRESIARLAEIVETARVRLERPNGLRRDTTVAVQRVGGTFGARIRIMPSEVVAGMRVTVTLTSGRFDLYEGSSTVDTDRSAVSSLNVRVRPIVGGIEAGPPRSADAIGQVIQLGGALLFQSGDTIPGLVPEWSSMTPEVAKVLQGANAETTGNGSARLVARYEGLADTSRVDVRQVAAEVTRINPHRVTIKVGRSVQFTAVGTDRLGSPLLPGADAAWDDVRDEGALALTRLGRVLGLAPVEAFVTARGAGAKRASARLTVVASSPTDPPVLAWGGVMVGDPLGQGHALVSLPGAATPTRNPVNGDITFVASGRLYRADSSGGVTRIDTGDVIASWPEYALDGSWIFFGGAVEGSGSEIYRVRPDGTGLERLTFGGGSQPTSSPDVRKLAYVRNGDIWILPIGGQSRRVFGASANAPTWSPDGEWIAFSNGFPNVVKTVRPDGSEARMFTGSGAFPGVSWSPAGAWLIGFGSGSAAVLFDAEGGEARVLNWRGAGGFAWSR